MSESEIRTILLCYHFGPFHNFKHYYLFFIRECLSGYFPSAVSYNRFVELLPRVFFQMVAFMRIYSFCRCSGISFVDSAMIPVYHTMQDDISTRFLTALSRAGKARWDGAMDSSCTYSAMIRETS